MFDPEALFRDPDPAPQFAYDPKHDKVQLTPKLIIGIVVVLALLGGCAYWAMSYSKRPAPLAAASGTTVPPVTAALVPPPVPAPPGFVSHTASGVTLSLPADCTADRLPPSQLAGDLGPQATLLYSCATPDPRRFVMVLSLAIDTSGPDSPDDDSLASRMSAGEGLAKDYGGTGAPGEVQDHLVFGRPGVLVNVTTSMEGQQLFTTIALGRNIANEFFLVMVGGVNQPWPEGMVVVDSAR